MYTPITVAIFRGPLSPLCLKEAIGNPEKWQAALRLLKHLPAEADAVEHLLRNLAASWQADLPAFSADDNAACGFRAPDDTTVLSCLPPTEVENPMPPASDNACATPQLTLYTALLNGEACWLKLLLRKRIEALRCDLDASLLLCDVLGEVYSICELTDDAYRAAPSAWWLQPLCRAMISLYIELISTFGYLLGPDDYPDYRHLPFASRLSHSSDAPDVPCICTAPTYEACRAVNRVKRFIALQEEPSAAGARAVIPEASRLYRMLPRLWQELPVHSPYRTCVCSAIGALENFLFFLYKELSLKAPHPYASLSSAAWCDGQTCALFDGEYADHLRYSEARGAVHWIKVKLREKCLTFLLPEEWPTGSIPRRLKSGLIHMLAIYERHYPAVYRPLMPEKEFSLVPADDMPPSAPDPIEIHRMLHFLCEQKNNHGRFLMDPLCVKQLEEDFMAFLQGKQPPGHKQKLTMPKNHNSIIYGVFFYYHQQKGGDKWKYALFLLSVFKTHISSASLLKNYSHYIQAYKEYVHIAG